MSKIEGSVGASHPLLKFVDSKESYGRHVLESFIEKNIHVSIKVACDIGVGLGNDLEIVRNKFKDAKLIGIDFTQKDSEVLASKNISLQIKNIENEVFDFEDNSVDLFIANQVFEHVKELFWINDQVAKKLKIGGYLIIGVPNISALHSRLLFLFGVQPSQMKSYSAHIRGFAQNEIERFLKICFPGGYNLVIKKGAQFYPFPKQVSRLFARVLPNYCQSLFFLFQKTKDYSGEFLKHPVNAKLETNFFTGKK